MPSNRKKIKNKRTKPKATSAKKGRSAANAKRSAKSSRPSPVGKKQAKKKSVKSRGTQRRPSPVLDERQLESAQARVDELSEQSGDLQGLSRTEEADSESVDELAEEGNPFEAGVIEGVEEADNEDEKEVHTHEVPEDDVPDEYLENE